MALNLSLGILHNRHPFKIPTLHKTLIAYANFEFGFLRFIVNAFEDPVLDRTGKPLFEFDGPQGRALSNLVYSLEKRESIAQVSPLAVEALHHLYFPANPDRCAFNSFIEPASSFFAMICLTSEGVARPIKEVTPFCAKMQFSMRLRGLHYLYTTHRDYVSQSHLLTIDTQPTPGSHHSSSIKSTKESSLLRTTATSVPTRSRHSRTALKSKATSLDESDSDSSPSDDNSEYSSNSAPSDFGGHAASPIGTMDMPQIKTTLPEKTWWKCVLSFFIQC